MTEYIFNLQNQIILLENCLISIAVMSRNSQFFPELKGIKVTQKYEKEEITHKIEILIVTQKLNFNFCEFTKNQLIENLFVNLKIYYKIFMAIEYLNKMDLRIDDLNLEDLYIHTELNNENSPEKPIC